VHAYWLHILHSAPDYDQTVHVVIDMKSCKYLHGDAEEDVMRVGATFVTNLPNDVHHRLHSSYGKSYGFPIHEFLTRS